VLEQLHIPATVFAVAGAFGAWPAWGESYFAPEERVMSAEQLRELPTLISVGSHTLTHPNLAALSVEAAAREITESRNKLESLLQRPVKSFSFPHGEFNDSCISECREAGYERVFSTSPTLIRDGQSGYLVGRVAADPWDWRLEFKLKMLGAYGWQPYAQSAKKRMQRLLAPTETTNAIRLETLRKSAKAHAASAQRNH
jgi:peptidoglycan/xylan/chitin deacetylase (PgdA/CDA1 family)